MKKTERKLKQGIVFVGSCYIKYQIPFIKRYIKVHSCSEAEATTWYIGTGLAALFEKHHRPHDQENEIVVSEMGQKIN